MSARNWFATAFLLVCLPTEPVRAWAPAGHKIAVSIAYRLITPQRREELTAILRQHPRFAEDFAKKLPENLPAEHHDEWIWHQASIWPDITRGFAPELKETWHRGPWHYCNRPLFLSDADRLAMEPMLTVNLKTDVPAEDASRRVMNVLQAIEYNKGIALDSRAAPADRALALSWVFHLTGDIHQPLHSVSMFSEKLFPSLLEGDRGGNNILTKPGERLHGVWDNFPGGDIKHKAAMERALTWMHDDEYKRPAEQAARDMSPLVWFDESHALACDYGYNEEVTTYLKQLDPAIPPEDRPKLILSEDYLRTGGLIARQRVVTAGFRLGKTLQSND